MSDPHRRVVAWSTALHREIAARLRADPDAVLAKASLNLQRWRAQFGGTLPYCYREWERILSGNLSVLECLLEADDENALRLKSSSPFAGILTPRERLEIMRRAA